MIPRIRRAPAATPPNTPPTMAPTGGVGTGREVPPGALDPLVFGGLYEKTTSRPRAHPADGVETVAEPVGLLLC